MNILIAVALQALCGDLSFTAKSFKNHGKHLGFLIACNFAFHSTVLSQQEIFGIRDTLYA